MRAKDIDRYKVRILSIDPRNMHSISILFLVLIAFAMQTITIARINSQPNGKTEILFCSSRGEISLVSFNESLITNNGIKKHIKKRFLNTPKSRSLLNMSCTHGLNYDLIDNYIVWSNVSSISVAHLDKGSKNALTIYDKKVLLLTNEVNKMSLDWIHDLLYFIDRGEINVVNIKDSNRRTILNNDYKNTFYVNDVVVNPIESFIVWIEWDRKTFGFKIVKADQSGANKKVLVDRGFYSHESRFFQPCCLSIDYDLKRIYFIDSKLETLESLLFNGRERVIHLRSTLLAVANSLDIYENHVYWSNEGQNLIFSANKLYHGVNGRISAVYSGNSNIESIRGIHSSRQPKTENRCASSQCSNLCIPIGSDQYRCVCNNQNTKTNQCQEYQISSKDLPTAQQIKKVENISNNTNMNEIVITETQTKSYPLYVFKCHAVTNETTKLEWFTEDDIKLTQKYSKSHISKNMTSDGNSIELKLSYPYVKQLNTFKCKASLPNNDTVQEIFKVIVRQLPQNPKILSQSFSFGISKVFITLQIENSKVEPPIDKYRLTHKASPPYSEAFYQQEYSVDFKAVSANSSDRNTIYVIKLDIDYASADLMAFKLFAHNEVGWSFPFVY